MWRINTADGGKYPVNQIEIHRKRKKLVNFVGHILKAGQESFKESGESANLRGLNLET